MPFTPDLLFYNRKLKRLVVIDLKLGDFKAAEKGQMELYLRWLDKHERQPDEMAPIGLILCAGKKQETIELLELSKSSIRVAEYLTELPSRKLLEQKLHKAVEHARKRFNDKIILPGKKAVKTKVKTKKRGNEEMNCHVNAITGCRSLRPLARAMLSSLSFKGRRLHGCRVTSGAVTEGRERVNRPAEWCYMAHLLSQKNTNISTTRAYGACMQNHDTQAHGDY